jgi:hypothetical protein
MLKFMHRDLNSKITKRYITKEEVKLFNLAKIFLEGGWVFEEESIASTLVITGI